MQWRRPRSGGLGLSRVAALLCGAALMASPALAQSGAPAPTSTLVASWTVETALERGPLAAAPQSAAYSVWAEQLPAVPVYVELAVRHASGPAAALPTGRRGALSLSALGVAVETLDSDARSAASTPRLRLVPGTARIDGDEGRRTAEKGETLAAGEVYRALFELSGPGKEPLSAGAYAVSLNTGEAGKTLKGGALLTAKDSFVVEVKALGEEPGQAALEDLAERHLRASITFSQVNTKLAQNHSEAAVSLVKELVVADQVERSSGALASATTAWVAHRVYMLRGEAAEAHKFGLELLECATSDCTLRDAYFGRAGTGVLPREFADHLALSLTRFAE